MYAAFHFTVISRNSAITTSRSASGCAALSAVLTVRVSRCAYVVADVGAGGELFLSLAGQFALPPAADGGLGCGVFTHREVPPSPWFRC